MSAFRSRCDRFIAAFSWLLLGSIAVPVAVAAETASRPARGLTPIQLIFDYRYNFEQLNEGISYRTGADPVMVRHADAYYLFLTLADGYWRSTNLLDWAFISPNRWPFESEIAPAALSDGDRLILMQAAFEPKPLLVSTDPAHGKFDFLTRRLPDLPDFVSQELAYHILPGKIPPGPGDPALFKDGDGRVYLYWGSAFDFPLYGIGLDLGQPVH